MRSLLIVEDDAGLREQMEWAFKEAFDVRGAESLQGALAAFPGSGPDLACVDLGLEGRPDRGLDVLDALLSADASRKVVAITASDDGALGREAIRRGAFDFLRKPVDAEALRLCFDRALRIRDLEEEPGSEGQPSWTPVKEEEDFALLGESEALRKVFAALRRLAPLGVDVLFSGEPGSGREAAARALHDLGPRKDGPFIAVRCAGLPEEILESTLFGRPGGGPDDQFREDDPGIVGAVESARDGSLFLEGVEEMPPSLQGRLLRWMRDGSIPGRAPATSAGRPRLLASCAREAGVSPPRSDLQRVLGGFEVVLPPLRDRGRDILVLARTLVERSRVRLASPRLRLSVRAEKRLLSHAWPGNIRELEDRLARAALICRGAVIEDADLGLEAEPDLGLDYRAQKRAFERAVLLSALKRANGNVSLAARTLGVTRPTFYDMMRKAGVRVEAKI
jgi:two-component system NtrC family response regulator